MSGQYKTAWLCEALLVSRSGYYAWIKRRRFPGPRQLENMRLRERIREEFARSRQTYGSPRLAQVLGCPGRRNRIARLMRLEHFFARERSLRPLAIPAQLLSGFSTGLSRVPPRSAQQKCRPGKQRNRVNTKF